MISRSTSDAAESAGTNLATTANGKASVAGSKPASEGSVELDNMENKETKLPLHEDIMQLARLGEIGPVQTLLDSGKYDAKYKDEEGITPLHWAAINNHYAMCKFLIESGADVDAKGGESVATPAMWAAQRCHLYIVHLLLQNGADPLLTDVQGYNILHLATFDGNVFLLLILLHENIPVDAPDPQGHTCLMWAAYKGYPACVELFLNWGASVHERDESGFTALHWALVKGNYSCIHKVIASGADRFAESNTGKTPAVVANEMKSTPRWHKALKDQGYYTDGTPKQLPLPYISFIKNPSFLTRLFFLSPFLIILVVFYLMSNVIIYAAIPLTIIMSVSLQWVAHKVLLWAPSNMNTLHHTPHLAGIFAASLFWVGVRWMTTILQSTFSSHPIFNLFFAVSFGLCTYFYIYAMSEDPGYVPKLGSRTQQKSSIDELISLWKFDDQSFCVGCMSRMPVRSKHCKICKRCVAKHDHHCPWIYNCVGANNHRHFFVYIIAMEVGILFFLRLVVYHIESLPNPEKTECSILPSNVCQYILRDNFTAVLSIWTSLQLTWVSMLIITQLFLISRAQTTYESLKGSTHYQSRASEVLTSAVSAGTTTLEGAQLPTPGMSLNTSSSGQQPKRPSQDGFFTQWKKLLGIDTFVATTTGGADGSGRSRRRANPFSRGIITNCRDFWCDPAPYFGKRATGAGMLDGEVVDYSRMYEPPPRMKLRRPRQDGDGGVYHSVDSDDAV